MSNHQSHFDVLAVVAALPAFQLRWVAKKELTKAVFAGAAAFRPSSSIAATTCRR
jgi:1-acyl-sn-glycerol-3-phosphate acyltransferase